MEKFYIQVDNNGVITDHPMSLESAINLVSFRLDKHAYEVDEAMVLANGFKHFEFHDEPPQLRVLGENGYELQANGIVRRKYITQELTQEERLNYWIRRGRDDQLIKSDWTQLPDNRLTAAQRAEWATFREQLRSMTTTYANAQDPKDIVWPTPPLGGLQGNIGSPPQVGPTPEIPDSQHN
jgi:hypothetical protein